MQIPRAIFDELIAHAREEAPNEACGLIGGNDGRARTVYRARNAEASSLRYSIHGQDVLDLRQEIEDKGEEMVGIYHSHTNSEAYPSQTDINLAFWAGDPTERMLIWPDAVYLIVSLAKGEVPLRGFAITEDAQVNEVDLSIE